MYNALSMETQQQPSTMTRTSDSLAHLTAQLAKFADERDWDQFHNPKNLAMALAGEAGELVEHFQWLTFEQAANLPTPRARKSHSSAPTCCCSCCA
jgi:hypothetical protein